MLAKTWKAIAKSIAWLVLTVMSVALLAACGGSATPEAASSAPETSGNGPSAISVKLNLHEATGDEFQAAIPDFGNRMVREFLEYRPYISIQQFRREIGKYVDEEQVAFFEQFVYVPIDTNEIFEHVEHNLAFELEIRPNAAVTEVFLETLHGANPLLAPGVLALGGVLALAATYYHHVLE